LKNSNEIGRLLKLTMSGLYPGDKRLKSGTNRPIYTQRTSFLYYSRKNIGEAMLWDTLSMGVMKDLSIIISDKKASIDLWFQHNPKKFKDLQKYIPFHCSNDLKCNLDENKIYVFKPSNGADGHGLIFRKGKDIMNYTNTDRSWVIQEFINPYLYNNRKNHLRVLSLVLLRSNGIREFYLYKQMKMLSAPMEFDQDLLLNDNFINNNKSSEHMLVTNLRLSREIFNNNPSNKNKVFNQWSVVLDTKDVFNTYLYEKTFKDIYDFHYHMYNLIGDMFQCTPTEISIDNGCFHIMASDLVIDKNENPFFLEINAAMGIKGLWKPEEVKEFSEGVSYIIGNKNSPFKGLHTDNWVKINIKI